MGPYVLPQPPAFRIFFPSLTVPFKGTDLDHPGWVRPEAFKGTDLDHTGWMRSEATYWIEDEDTGNCVLRTSVLFSLVAEISPDSTCSPEMSLFFPFQFCMSLLSTPSGFAVLPARHRHRVALSSRNGLKLR